MSEERRRSARVAVEIACSVRGDGGEAVEATMRDVSAVGARLVVPEPVAEDLAPLELDVPETDGRPSLRVGGRVMYHRDRPEGIVLGVQFIDMDAAIHRRVGDFLEAILGGEGGGQREHPRVAQRIEVSCRTKDRAKAVLEDISKGGLRLRVPEEMDAGEPIEVAIAFGKLDEPLTLSGQVVRTKRVDDGRVFAAVKLDELSEANAQLLERLMSALVRG